MLFQQVVVIQFFDLHCDTLYRIATENLDSDSSQLAISLEKSEIFDKYTQMLAVWIPDEIRGDKAFEFFKKCLKIYKEQYKPHINSNRNFLLSVENGSVISGDISKIKQLSEYGVRAVTLIYNEDNELGSGAYSQSHFGLTDIGKEAVTEFEKQGIVVDVSHSSVKAFYDIANISRKPIIATHSNSYKLCPHKRNITDEQFGIIKASGGLVGVNFYPPFLNSNADNATLTDIIKHIEHFLSLGGEDVVSVGSDFDGCEPIKELDSLDKVPILYENLLKLNYNEQVVQKILYTNAHNFFTLF